MGGKSFMTVLICVGSSCHIKGSYEIIELMKKAISDNKLENKVVLKATFCLEKCAIAGVSIKVDDQIITGVTNDNFDEIFNKWILSPLK